MSLSEYKKKRSFSKTPEPEGRSSKGKSKAGKELVFVVQKHAATRLHYDFRLEMKGTLKSWAVPKGPSLNPDDKRLAMMVEDHPFDYKDFEGTIPQGNYGGGTVIIWDEGVYEPMEIDGPITDPEKLLMKELHRGDIKIHLKGKKLKGDFALVKMKTAEDNAWLLIKKKDKYAGDTDITLKDKSVVSGKTLEQVARNKQSRQWVSAKTSVKKGLAPKKTKKISSAGKRKKVAKKRAASVKKRA